MEEVESSSVIIALRLNGEALPHDHEGPYRLIAEAKGCNFSVKWVDFLISQKRGLTQHYQHRQPEFSVLFDSSPSPDTLLLLTPGISVSGIESWVRQLADLA